MERAVVVCNVFPDDNKGGCAITQQTIDWLKRSYPGHDVHLIPVEQNRDYDEMQYRFTLRRHPDVRVLRCPVRAGRSPLGTARELARSLWWLWMPPGHSEFEGTLSRAELVVGKGGYVFVERETLRGLLSLWFTAYPLVYAASKGTRTVVLCATIGPFRRAGSRLLSRWILRRIDLVVTRDPISTAEAKKLGCTSVMECPDITFTLDPERIQGAGPFAIPAETYAVMVVSAERGRRDDEFLDRLRTLAGLLLDEKTVERVVVVVQSTEDAQLSTRFVERCGDPRITLMMEDLAPEELMGFYAAAGLVITKRLHAGLFSMMAGTPVLMFSTDGLKSDGILRQIELTDRLLPYPDFSVDEAYRRIREILEGGEAEVERVRETLGRGRREAERVLDEVAAALRVTA